MSERKQDIGGGKASLTSGKKKYGGEKEGVKENARVEPFRKIKGGEYNSSRHVLGRGLWRGPALLLYIQKGVYWMRRSQCGVGKKEEIA